MNWFLYATLAALLWAFSNHIDKQLIERYCKNAEIGSLLIFSALIGMPVSLLIYFFSSSVLFILPITALLLVIAGMLYIFGLIPYMYALGEDEASNVAPLFLMSPIFSLMLAWVVLNEALSGEELLGVALILLGAGWLSVETEGKIGFRSKTVLLMALTSLSVALNALLFKYSSLDNVSFWTLIFWEHLGFIVAGSALLLYKPYRKQFKLMIKKNTVGVLGLIATNETITLVGNMAFHYATLLAFIAIVETVTGGLQPIFVLIIGVLITIFFPKLGKEDITGKRIVQKLASIVVMLVGLSIINLGFIT